MLARRDADVVARVRAALSVPGDGIGGARPRRAAAAVRRARHDRRRSLGLGVVGLVVVAGAALAPRAGTDPVAARSGPAGSSGPWGAPAAGSSSPADPLVAASLLDLDQVSILVPGVIGRAPAADVTPPTAGGYPAARYRGGWCGDAVLLDAPSPQQVWAAEWDQEGLAGTTATRGPAGSVREVVLRWPGAAGARAWADATHASPTRCRDPRGAPFPLTAFRPWAVATTTSTMTSVAVAPVVRATAADPAEPQGVPVWRVRAVHSRGTTAVDLTVVVRALDAGEAVESVTLLLEAAAARAEQGERGEVG